MGLFEPRGGGREERSRKIVDLGHRSGRLGGDPVAPRSLLAGELDRESPTDYRPLLL